MGLLNIIGRLVLDGSNFDSGLKNAEKQAEKFAENVRKKLIGGGVTAAAGFLVANTIREATQSAVEINKLAKQFKLTTDEVQLLRQEAEETGRPFEELVKDAEKLEQTLGRMRGGAVDFSQTTVTALSGMSKFIADTKDALTAKEGRRAGYFWDAIAGAFGIDQPQREDGGQAEFKRIQEERKRTEDAAAKEREKQAEKTKKINDEAKSIEEKTADSQLSKNELINKLVKERRKLVEEIQKFPNVPGSEGEANDRLKLAKLNAAIAAAEGNKQEFDATIRKQKSYSPLTDNLIGVGNFYGANPNAETRSELKEANRTLKEIDRKLGQTQQGGAFPL